MRFCRTTTRHTFVFFTLHYPSETSWYDINFLKPQLAFFTPKNAVYFAVMRYNQRLLVALLSYSADVNEKYCYYYTPIHNAVTNQQHLSIRLLLGLPALLLI